MHIRINDFAGTFPRLHPTKLPEHAAQSCQNVMVEHDILSPSNQAVQSFPSNEVGLEKFVSATFFQYGGQTYKKFSNEQVSFAFSPVHESYKLYWTGEGAVNKPLRFNVWETNLSGSLVSDRFDYIAGMPPIDPINISVTAVIKGPPLPPPEPAEDDDTPAPTPAPVIPEGTKVTGDELAKIMSTQLFRNIFSKVIEQVKAANENKKEPELDDAVTEAVSSPPVNKEARVYAFTYVNRFGDESVPSVKEELIFTELGDKPVLTITYAAGERENLVQNYGVNKIRLYRSVTNSLGVAQFLFIKEVSLSMTGSAIEITDDVPQGSLMIGEPLATINYDPPRVGMRGLGVTDSGVGYAYVDKTICLSEPYILYAWPRYYELSTQHTIMGMGHYDNTIVVATTGNPVLITGDAPESMGALSLPLYEGCVSSRSMVNLNHGCMYASENGLVLVTGNSAKLLTETLFATDDWQKIKPSSIHASSYKNGYLFFWDNGSAKGSGYIDLNNPAKGVMWFDDYALNTFLDKGVVQMITRQTDYLNTTLSVYKAFNPEYGQDKTKKVYKWRSKTFKIDTPRRMLAAQVIADTYEAGTITFRVYADGALLHETLVSSERAFRIKNHSARRDFSVEVQSSTPIREIVLGETMRDLIV